MTDSELMAQATQHILNRMRREGYYADGDVARQRTRVHGEPTIREINNGWCAAWARRVRYMIPRAREHSERDADGLVHAWIELDGRFYDAECLDGVDDPDMLPFYTDQLV